MSKKRTCGIYLIQIQRYFYIGSSNDVYKRFKRHRSELIRNTHFNCVLQNVYNKYKEYNFYLLEECTEEKLMEIEQFYLDICFDDKNCVNISKSSDCPTRGRSLTESHKESLRKNHPKLKMSKEHLEKLRSLSRQRKWNDNQRSKCIRRGAEGGTSRAIELEFSDGHKKQYSCFKDAERELGINETTIRGWIKGKTKFPYFSQSKKFKHLGIVSGRYLGE